MKFSEKVGNGPVTKQLNFCGDTNHRPRIQGLFSGFVTIGRYGKWLTHINLLFILIRQMAALVRRALAEVCTVRMLLVVIRPRRTRSTADMRPVVGDGIVWCVCRSVCLLRLFALQKTAEPIDMPLGAWIRVGPRKHILDGGCTLAQPGEYD